MMAAEKMKEIDKVLADMSVRYQARHGGELPPGAHCVEAVDTRTPFDELCAMEAEYDDEGEEAVRIFLESHARLLDFLFADGPHPAVVMRRLYAWVKKYRPSLIWDMGYRELGVLLDESHAAMEWRIGRIIDEFGQARGLRGMKVPWQRTVEACESYKERAMGNRNRSGSGDGKFSKSRRGPGRKKKTTKPKK